MEDQEKADRDNRANQLNPNNPAYESSRQGSQRDDDYDSSQWMPEDDD